MAGISADFVSPTQDVGADDDKALEAEGLAVGEGTVDNDDGILKVTSSNPSFVAAIVAELLASPTFGLFEFGDNGFVLDDDKRLVRG